MSHQEIVAGVRRRGHFALSETERVPTLEKLSAMQFLVATLVGLNYDYREIARMLDIQPSTAKYHAVEAANKVPGDLPVQAKLAAWSRGATIDVLEGRSLRVEVDLRATERRKRPRLLEVAGQKPRP